MQPDGLSIFFPRKISRSRHVHSRHLTFPVLWACARSPYSLTFPKDQHLNNAPVPSLFGPHSSRNLLEERLQANRRIRRTHNHLPFISMVRHAQKREPNTLDIISSDATSVRDRGEKGVNCHAFCERYGFEAGNAVVEDSEYCGLLSMRRWKERRSGSSRPVELQRQDRARRGICT